MLSLLKCFHAHTFLEVQRLDEGDKLFDSFDVERFTSVVEIASVPSERSASPNKTSRVFPSHVWPLYESERQQGIAIDGCRHHLPVITFR